LNTVHDFQNRRWLDFGTVMIILFVKDSSFRNTMQLWAISSKTITILLFPEFFQMNELLFLTNNSASIVRHHIGFWLLLMILILPFNRAYAPLIHHRRMPFLNHFTCCVTLFQFDKQLRPFSILKRPCLPTILHKPDSVSSLLGDPASVSPAVHNRSDFLTCGYHDSPIVIISIFVKWSLWIIWLNNDSILHSDEITIAGMERSRWQFARTELSWVFLLFSLLFWVRYMSLF
jgi:hypothetical protein